jgi:hypothetical protein
VWNTALYPNGEHLLALAVYDAQNRLVGRDEVRVAVENREG